MTLPRWIMTGPWHVEDGANSHLFEKQIVTLNGECVAFAAAEESDLIASAPSMRAALERALQVLEYTRRAHPEITGTIALHDAIAAAKEVLALSLVDHRSAGASSAVDSAADGPQ